MNEEKAKISVGRYMRAWISNNIAKMYKNSQITWKSQHNDKVLKELYAGLHLQEFEILGAERAGSCAYKVAVIMKINNETVASCVNVISETAAYKPEIDGVIGVNPISVLRYKIHQ